MSRIQKFRDEIIRFRQDLHRHPEIAYQEVWTQKHIVENLKKHGINCDTEFFKTAVVADIHGRLGAAKKGKTIALRADMDALKITENAGGGVVSESIGKMHACGHDFHMAALFGAAVWLNENRDAFDGCVRIIFQPAEEGTDPKENMIDGAIGLIEKGVLKNVDAIFGMHVWPELEFGTVGVCDGKTMAAADFFDVRITGKGGHISLPHKNRNPIYAAVEFANNMLWLGSQHIDPFEPALIGLGYLRSGSANNVIPEHAELGGSVRCFDDNLRGKIKDEFEKFADTISEKYEVDCECVYKSMCAPVINDPKSSEFFRKSCVKVEGVKQVVLPKPVMIAEDFGEFLKRVPGAFAWLGISKDPKSSFGLHSPSFFAYDETALLGAEIFIQVVLDYLT